MKKPITLKAVRGLRNNTTPERFEPGDLAVGENVDIDSTGRLTRRKGYVNVVPGDMHSLWANTEHCFAVFNGGLHRVLPDLTLEDLFFTVRGARVSYANAGSVTYFSDEFVTGSVRADGRVRGWGFPTPETPDATVGVGDLAPGTYQYAMTFVRDDGFESGASRARATTLTAAAGLEWADLPASTEASYVRIYLSAPNSELLYHAGDFQATGGPASIRGIRHYGVRLRSQFLGPPPPGIVFGPWMGRIFVASGQFLSYTRPFEYEVTAPRSDWWAFNDRINTVAFVDDGVYVGTTHKTYFVQGGDPTNVTIRQVFPYGTIKGTEVTVDPELVGEGLQGMQAVYWMSHQGICLGLPGGQVTNLTGERYETANALYGAGVFVDRNGLPQYRVSMFDYTGEAAVPTDEDVDDFSEV